MKKFTIFITLFAFMFGITPLSTASAQKQSANEINIAVDEQFYGLDIVTMTKHSSAVDQAFTMIYDRLLAFENGRITSDIALSYELLPSDDPGEGGNDSWADDFYIPECPEEWIEGYYAPPGMLDWEDTEELNFLDGSGQMIIRITLRDDVYFSDNSNLTAEDVAQWIVRAKSCPTDTLLYKQWESVFSAIEVDSTTIDLYMDLSDKDYGYVDFIYSLTTPIASIIKYDNGYIGTGAYSVAECENNFVKLERRSSWWKGEVSGADYVNFYYYASKNEIQMQLQSGDVSIAVSDGYAENLQHNIESGELKEKRIATNPIAVLLNKEDSLLSNKYIRKGVFYGINANTMIDLNYFELVGTTHDYWTFDGHNYPGLKKNEDGYTRAIFDIYKNIGLEDDYSVPLSIITDNNDFNIRIGEYIVEDMNSRTKNPANQTDNYRFNATLNRVSDELYESALESGGYQLIIKEIELSEIDSAYKYLNGKSTENMDKHLYKMKKSADLNTFHRMHKRIQAERCNNYDLFIAGWKYKSIVYNNNISGIKFASGYNPVSLISYPDFRGVNK